MAPTQRRNQKDTVQKSQQSSSQSNDKTTQSQEQRAGSSFLLYLILGFILLLGYTIWSSIQTYSNSMISDME